MFVITVTGIFYFLRSKKQMPVAYLQRAQREIYSEWVSEIYGDRGEQ